MIKKVCIFCASSNQVAEVHLEAATELGKILAEQGITVVYGGGSVGTMGALANSVLDHQGKIIGIIPKFMVELEWENTKVTELVIVESMAERKIKMLENADAIIALPGGTGTLDELMEALALKKLGMFTKPIIILNTKGFYDHLMMLFEKMVADKFIRPEHKKLYEIASKPEEILIKIKEAPLWDSSAIKLAAL
jgi:uncharacterized protein (TIGR00730 family)